ncbi:hypothetical protein AB0346_18655 [Nocardia beijingensis]|uniref:hypothetical protein n=1 Tax=Nocardia beijingensis TaxID=95162 RepID=UPI00344BFE4F
MQSGISPETLALIENLTETSRGGFTPLHEVRDAAKLADLTAGMRRSGWQGPPLVVDGEQALTGSHRYWAAVASDTDIPRVAIAELCEALGVDWEAHLEEHDGSLRIDGAYRTIADKLPAEVVYYLGLDLH